MARRRRIDVVGATFCVDYRIPANKKMANMAMILWRMKVMMSIMTMTMMMRLIMMTMVV